MCSIVSRVRSVDFPEPEAPNIAAWRGAPYPLCPAGNRAGRWPRRNMEMWPLAPRPGPAKAALQRRGAEGMTPFDDEIRCLLNPRKGKNLFFSVVEAACCVVPLR